MGIRHLETYMKQFLPDGVFKTSIPDMCDEFSRNNGGVKPTIVIDLMGLLNLLSRDHVVMLYGGRHSQYKLDFENLLEKLQSVAQLVFFEDGPLVSGKINTWTKRQNEKYFSMIDVIDHVSNGVPLQEIVEGSRNIPTISTFLTMIEETAMKYGKLVVTVTKECDAELARYATNDSTVVAVLADDSDFLIFGGDWRYISINQLDMNTLVTLEYNKIALRSYLGLNDEQLKIFSTLGGNDIVQYQEVRKFHEQNCGHNAQNKFPFLAKFIKEQMPPRNQVVDWIASEVLQDSRPFKKEQIVESLMQYRTKFDITDFSVIDPLLHFCRENYLDFTFSILQRVPKKMTLLYYDLRLTDCPDLFDVATELFRKQIGILLKHKNENIRYEIFTKRDHYEGFLQFYVNPIYPGVEIPPLLELLHRKEFPEHDKLRFKLLKWIIGLEKLNFDLNLIPRNYLLDILVLTWLKRNGFITKKEADLILLTIKQVELDLLPQNLQPPPVVSPRAFFISFMFTKYHITIERALEVVGLKKSMTKLLNFDGVLFHKLYLDMANNKLKPSSLLHDLDSYRLYK